MVLPPSIAPWVGLLLFAASVPALLRGVFGAVTALGLGSFVDAAPGSLVKDGIFAVGFGLLTGAGMVLFYRPTAALFLVLVAPGLAVLGGLVCIAVAGPARRRAARAEGREAAGGETGGETRAESTAETSATPSLAPTPDGPPAAGDPSDAGGAGPPA